MAARVLPPPPAIEALLPNDPVLPRGFQSALGLQGMSTPLSFGAQQGQQLPLLLLNLLASAVPVGLANPARIASLEQIQPLLTKNLQSITEMNRNLFDVLEAMQGKGMESGEVCSMSLS